MKNFKCIGRVAYLESENIKGIEISYHENPFWNLYKKSFVYISVWHALKVIRPMIRLFDYHSGSAVVFESTFIDEHNIELKFIPTCDLYKCVLTDRL